MAFLNDSLSLTILLTFLILILIYEDFEQVQLGSVEFCFKSMIPVIKNFTYMATTKRLKYGTPKLSGVFEFYKVE